MDFHERKKERQREHEKKIKLKSESTVIGKRAKPFQNGNNSQTKQNRTEQNRTREKNEYNLTNDGFNCAHTHIGYDFNVIVILKILLWQRFTPTKRRILFWFVRSFIPFFWLKRIKQRRIKNIERESTLCVYFSKNMI